MANSAAGQFVSDVRVIRWVSPTNSPATDYTDYTKKISWLNERKCFRKDPCLIGEIRGKFLEEHRHKSARPFRGGIVR